MTFNHSDINTHKHIQQSALMFLKRHHARHIGNDQKLFHTTVNHLILSYGLSRSIAEKLTSLADSDLQIAHQRRRLELSASSDKLAMITDPDSSMKWAVPVTVIAEQVRDALDNSRLRLV
nr:hypothetical protein [uncultured Pseudomonas sp.]